MSSSFQFAGLPWKVFRGADVGAAQLDMYKGRASDSLQLG
jgi:hypothetical protein